MERKYKIFISSVQSEFQKERTTLLEYIQSDVLLSSFFQTFIFERISANTLSPEHIFTNEVRQSDIYIGLLGASYGFEATDGISPTEKEYDTAKTSGITRWVFILNTTEKRHPKQEQFIKKVSNDVSWKLFSNIENLKKEVYHSCVNFLKQRGKIENNDFDNSLHEYATFDSVNDLLISEFIDTAREKRNFPEKSNAPKEAVLKRLNLTRNGKLVNSAILFFSDNPQQFFPSATVKCAHFHGDVVQKPIPDYKEFGGSVLEMVDKSVDFILSKISISTGTRSESNIVGTQYEIPRIAISEAVINAITHRDYYSKASIQISVFKNRIEIENPGCLPNEININDLKNIHSSYPRNPLLANCLFLTGAIERYGTGTLDILRVMLERNLPEPEFLSRTKFKVVLWRKQAKNQTFIPKKAQSREQDREQDREQVDEKIIETIICLEKQMPAWQIMEAIGLKARRNFIQNYLQPAINEGLVVMANPNKPTSKTQMYRLTQKGVSLKKLLNKPLKSGKIITNETGENSDEIRNKFGINSVEIRSKFGVNALKTIEIIIQNQEITAKEIAATLSVTKRTVENYLAKLKENGYIVREGSNKTGFWKILNRN